MNVFKELLLNNIGLKALSLLIAMLLWFQIAGQQTVQRTVSVPVEFVNMPPELEISGDYTRHVNAVIRKRSSVPMDERQLSAMIDLSSADAGPTVVVLTDQNIRNLPNGVEIAKIEPQRLRLELEQTRSKLVEVQPEIEGGPAEGYQLRDVRLSPGEVLISGPESHVDQINTTKTEPIDVSGRSESFVQRVYLDIEDPQLRIEHVGSVDAFVLIEEERKQLVLERVAVVVRGSSGELQASPKTVRVTASLPRSFEGTLKAEQLEARVDVAGMELPGGRATVIPRIQVPQDLEDLIRIEALEPSQIEIEAQR